jgi:hypothetical protein
LVEGDRALVYALDCTASVLNGLFIRQRAALFAPLDLQSDVPNLKHLVQALNGLPQKDHRQQGE